MFGVSLTRHQLSLVLFFKKFDSLLCFLSSRERTASALSLKGCKHEAKVFKNARSRVIARSNRNNWIYRILFLDSPWSLYIYLTSKDVIYVNFATPNFVYQNLAISPISPNGDLRPYLDSLLLTYARPAHRAGEILLKKCIWSCFLTKQKIAFRAQPGGGRKNRGPHIKNDQRTVLIRLLQRITLETTISQSLERKCIPRIREQNLLIELRHSHINRLRHHFRRGAARRTKNVAGGSRCAKYEDL